MGLTSDGTTVTTSLTGSEGNFVNGVFAKAATTVTKAAVPQPLQTLVVASGEPFVLPGTHILIAPIGAIITGVWAALFLATVGYGTVERIRFRDEYRRRRATASKGEYSRF
jgi:H+/gluconate symporter-like permease